MRAVDQPANSQQNPALVALPGLASAIEREVYRNGRVHLGRLVIEQIGLIPPLLHRIQSIIVEHWIRGGSNRQLLDRPRFGNNRVQNHRSAHMSDLRNGRVLRLDKANAITRNDTARDARWSRSLRWRNVNGRSRTSNNSSEDAARRSTGHAAHTCHAHGRRWRRSVFLNHLDVFRNLRGRM